MKISNTTRAHLETARLLLVSVADSLIRYELVNNTYDLRKEDSIESVYRRLKQARQEILAASRDFEGAAKFKWLSNQIEKHEV